MSSDSKEKLIEALRSIIHQLETGQCDQHCSTLIDNLKVLSQKSIFAIQNECNEKRCDVGTGPSFYETEYCSADKNMSKSIRFANECRLIPGNSGGDYAFNIPQTLLKGDNTQLYIDNKDNMINGQSFSTYNSYGKADLILDHYNGVSQSMDRNVTEFPYANSDYTGNIQSGTGGSVGDSVVNFDDSGKVNDISNNYCDSIQGNSHVVGTSSMSTDVFYRQYHGVQWETNESFRSNANFNGSIHEKYRAWPRGDCTYSGDNNMHYGNTCAGYSGMLPNTMDSSNYNTYNGSMVDYQTTIVHNNYHEFGFNYECRDASMRISNMQNYDDVGFSSTNGHGGDNYSKSALCSRNCCSDLGSRNLSNTDARHDVFNSTISQRKIHYMSGYVENAANYQNDYCSQRDSGGVYHKEKHMRCYNADDDRKNIENLNYIANDYDIGVDTVDKSLRFNSSSTTWSIGNGIVKLETVSSPKKKKRSRSQSKLENEYKYDDTEFTVRSRRASLLCTKQLAKNVNKQAPVYPCKLEYSRDILYRRAALGLIPNVCDPDIDEPMVLSVNKSSRNFVIEGNWAYCRRNHNLCRSTHGFKMHDMGPKNKIYWEFTFSKVSDEDHIRAGITSIEANIFYPPGADEFGYCIRDSGGCFHNREPGQPTKPFYPGQVVGLGLEFCDDVSKLHYWIDGDYMGCPFEKIPSDIRWYPSFSCYKQTQFTVSFSDCKYKPSDYHCAIEVVDKRKENIKIDVKELEKKMQNFDPSILSPKYKLAIDVALIPFPILVI